MTTKLTEQKTSTTTPADVRTDGACNRTAFREAIIKGGAALDPNFVVFSSHQTGIDLIDRAVAGVTNNVTLKGAVGTFQSVIPPANGKTEQRHTAAFNVDFQKEEITIAHPLPNGQTETYTLKGNAAGKPIDMAKKALLPGAPVHGTQWDGLNNGLHSKEVTIPNPTPKQQLEATLSAYGQWTDYGLIPSHKNAQVKAERGLLLAGVDFGDCTVTKPLPTPAEAALPKPTIKR